MSQKWAEILVDFMMKTMTQAEWQNMKSTKTHQIQNHTSRSIYVTPKNNWNLQNNFEFLHTKIDKILKTM